MKRRNNEAVKNINKTYEMKINLTKFFNENKKNSVKNLKFSEIAQKLAIIVIYKIYYYNNNTDSSFIPALFYSSSTSLTHMYIGINRPCILLKVSIKTNKI